VQKYGKAPLIEKRDRKQQQFSAEQGNIEATKAQYGSNKKKRNSPYEQQALKSDRAQYI